MKWGIRRFQNKDGSLTPEGRDRYRSIAINTRDTAETTKAYKQAIDRMNAVYKPVKDYYSLSEKERDKYIRKASDADYDRQIDLFDPQTEAKDREKM
ncbi:MAG: hypothetical protein J6X45_02545, partial [Lachnospiraceae bacterium]|nr:hypothetical protein [Lachnospiraceae bacterium]